jgi:hypothetical protein
MTVYCLNDETYGDECEDQFVWMAYWYECGDYDGCGEAIALGKDGFLYCAGLGHCSCYGPFEDGFEKMCSVEDFLGSLGTVHGYVSYAQLEEKVVDLLR